MLRTILTCLALAVLLTACSKPTDTVIPSDMATWDKDLAPVVQKLKEDDRALLVAYVARMKLAEVLSNDGPAIPFGYTVGQAIEDQRKWAVEEAKRVAEEKAERERKAAEERALQAKMEAQRAEAKKAISSAVTVTLLSKQELPRDYDANRFNPQQLFILGAENRGDKEIAGVSGEIEFVDVFDKVVGSVTFDMSERIRPGATYRWRGVRDFNRFNDEHRAVWNLSEGQYTTRFTPKMVVFTDGTRLLMPD